MLEDEEDYDDFPSKPKPKDHPKAVQNNVQ